VKELVNIRNYLKQNPSGIKKGLGGRGNTEKQEGSSKHIAEWLNRNGKERF
jgi:hypothetical protein